MCFHFSLLLNRQFLLILHRLYLCHFYNEKKKLVSIFMKKIKFIFRTSFHWVLKYYNFMKNNFSQKCFKWLESISFKTFLVKDKIYFILFYFPIQFFTHIIQMLVKCTTGTYGVLGVGKGFTTANISAKVLVKVCGGVNIYLNTMKLVTSCAAAVAALMKIVSLWYNWYQVSIFEVLIHVPWVLIKSYNLTQIYLRYYTVNYHISMRGG